MQRHNYQLWSHLRELVDMRLIAYRRAEWAVPFFLLPAFLRARKICQAWHPDVVFVGDSFLAPMAASLKSRYEVAAIAQLYGLDLTWDGRLYRRIVAQALKELDAVVCISRYAMELAADHGIGREKAKFVPGGFALPHPGWPRAKAVWQLELESRLGRPVGQGPVVLTVGRLVRRKGVADFIRRDLPVLKQRHGNLRYVVVGNGPDRENVERSVRETGLGDTVVCLGQISDDELETVYALADVFVMPNIHVEGDVEGFGLVALEAGAAGLPVVASAIEGIVDAVRDGESGVLALRDGGAGFADAVSKFLEDEEYRREFGKQAREYILRNFSWREVARQYANVFQEALRQARTVR